MDAAQFHNALRIFWNLDVLDLREAGVIDDNWGTPEASNRMQLAAFMEDPIAECLRMPDENFARLFAFIEPRLFAFIERRQPRHEANDAGQTEAKEGGQPCSDCPPSNYPTDKTRCAPCPRRSAPTDVGQTAPQEN